MIGVYSILLGASIVVSALFLLRREFKKSYFLNSKIEGMKIDTDQASVIESVDKAEKVFMEMSEAFYDISGDLEGKYSVHEKEISLLENRIILLENKIDVYEKRIKSLEDELKREILLKKSSSNKKNKIECCERVENNELPDSTEDCVNHKNLVIEDEAEVIKSEPTDIKSQIIALRSKGYSLKQIAKELDIGLGEIQLILNMKRS